MQSLAKAPASSGIAAARHRDRPFFLYLTHYEPHGPLSAKADRVAYYRKTFASLGETERNPIFAAMVEEVDRGTGQLMAAVNSLGLRVSNLEPEFRIEKFGAAT